MPSQPLPEQERSTEIVGPFNYRHLVVDGWTVPFVNAVEADGGRIHFTLDHRLGFDVAAADFDQVARLLANAIAIALGMPCHPQGDMSMEERELVFAKVQHPALMPTRLIGITSVEPGEAQ